ncbi:MAG: hypothetical protein Unbinned2716contig1004_30 [Prokaryotic dsDNA virus sp.]|nr:MAG: hypothetical protein Unbinned2716contig1004_30 [Prokaryotic dsDNA virus sp.]|tara:strand:- start:8816 stop:9157 length:342 start_codon:yes stop_codon:yes gene_type:complete
MDIIAVLEQFGLPVAMLCAFGYYIWRQNLWIQNDLTKDLHTKFNNIHSVVDSDLRHILIKLIDQQKLMQLDLKGIEKSQMTMERITIDIIGKLMDKDSGNGFKKKLEKFLKEN